ncbi:hypothetical protein EXIGLDRAFT_829540 [Exidia glandulosa HHB12029]|uniref:Copper transport protein n=1 Tax=Exidia glandulosa HHB12029 TaxID=1314781 RepID=A0A165PC84_EXIGL|nr:hypothetical protein EXIGLDRAFT_829540 [Exidia glandulosa HHB12029]
MIQARHDHGGATDGSGNSTGSSVFHFTGGDVIWFTGWAPSSPGAIAGAAIGLFLLAIVERWLAAMRIVMEAWWKQKAEAVVAARHVQLQDCHPAAEKVVEEGRSSLDVPSVPLRDSVSPRIASVRTSAPFILPHELSRGIFQTTHTAIQYALMLAVMSFQGAYFIAICFGAGVGEFLFGRYGRVPVGFSFDVGSFKLDITLLQYTGSGRSVAL